MDGMRAAAPGITLEVMIQVTPGHKADLRETNAREGLLPSQLH